MFNKITCNQVRLDKELTLFNFLMYLRHKTLNNLDQVIKQHLGTYNFPIPKFLNAQSCQ